MNAQYYIWADGNEQGPMSIQHLMRDWKSGALPKGFLWRRESDETYQSPDALVEEANPKLTTSPAPVAKVLKKVPRFGPSDFSGYLSMFMFVAGLVLFGAQFRLGVVLIILSLAILVTTYLSAMIGALNEIIRKLHEMDQR